MIKHKTMLAITSTLNDKHSSDMKEQRLQILRKVANGEMTPEQAHTALLGLSIISVPLPSSEAAYKEGLSRKRRGEKKQHWKAQIFAAGANWMKSIAIGCSDVVGGKEYVGNVR